MKKFYNKSVLFFSSFLLVLLFSFSAGATIYPIHNILSGTQEAPPNASPAQGQIVGSYNDETNTLSFSLIFGGLTGTTLAGHLHAPAMPGVNASVIIGFAGFPAGVNAGSYSNTYVLTAVQEADLMIGLMYVNVHTNVFPGGEIRAQLQVSNPGVIYTFNNVYSGTQEVPPNASTATGRIIGSFNPTTNTITYGLVFSGLIVPASAGHFHAPAPVGVNASVIIGYTGFPAATAGTYFNSHVINDLRESQLLGNLWYSNIHNPTFPGGEIRAQIILNIPAGITCPANVIASNAAGQCSRSVSFAATATGNPAPAITYSIGGNTITSPYNFPVGVTTVTASASNAAGTATCTFTVTVNDTEAPVISNMSATPNNLWPPNHKMHLVTVNYNSSDNCAGVINCALTVTSNEAVNGNGDGNTAPDWVVVNDHQVMLRAERSGKGNGRIYTIKATCTDAAGNSTSSTTTVSVAHDKGKAKNTVTVVEAKNAFGQLSLKAWPNPARNYFVLNIETAQRTDKVQVQVVDLTGRIVEVTQNIIGSQTLRVGSGLKAGVYFVRIVQGSETLQVKLMKME